MTPRREPDETREAYGERMKTAQLRYQRMDNRVQQLLKQMSRTLEERCSDTMSWEQVDTLAEVGALLSQAHRLLNQIAEASRPR